MSTTIILDNQERNDILKSIKNITGKDLSSNEIRVFLKKYSKVYYSIKAYGVDAIETQKTLKEALDS